jgi:signal transduction histidine kinase
MEYTGFSLVVNFFNVSSRKVAILKGLYLVCIFSFSMVLVFCLTCPRFEGLLDLIFLPSDTLPFVRYRNVVYLLAYFFMPLMLIGKLFVFYWSKRHYRKVLGASVLFFLFLVVVPMQIVDLLTFIGLVRVNHEVYYIRLYTPFISLAYAYVIWLKWIENEAQAEATFRVGVVAQGVVHDLRSPVAVLETLSKVCQGLKAEEQLLLSSATVRIERIIESLLDVYRGKKQTFIPLENYLKPESCNKIVSEVIRTKNFALENCSNLKIVFDYEDPNPQELFCNLNSSDLGRALDNIINNAIDASSLSIPESRVILVRLTQRNRTVEIEVADNGSPIEEAILNRLNRKEFGMTTKASGHGIGLKEVWRIVQAHQGTLHFEGKKEGGLRVRVGLPLLAAQVDAIEV